MNSSKMSLKEGFDFLFEEEEKNNNFKKKWNVTYKKASTDMDDYSMHLSFVLATDILSSIVNGKEKTPILEIFDNPAMSKDLEWAVGKTISFAKLEKISRTPAQFYSLFNVTSENVSGPINLIAGKYNHCIARLVSDQGAGKKGMHLVESKQSIIKISVQRYIRFINRMKSSGTIPKDARSKKSIDLNKLVERIYESVNRGEFVVSGLDNVEFSELDMHDKVLYSFRQFASELTDYQKKSIGIRSSKIFMKALSNKVKSVEEIYNSFKENMGKKVSKENKKIIDALVMGIINAKSGEEANQTIVNAVEEIPNDDISNEEADVEVCVFNQIGADRYYSIDNLSPNTEDFRLTYWSKKRSDKYSLEERLPLRTKTKDGAIEILKNEYGLPYSDSDVDLSVIEVILKDSFSNIENIPEGARIQVIAEHFNINLTSQSSEESEDREESDVKLQYDTIDRVYKKFSQMTEGPEKKKEAARVYSIYALTGLACAEHEGAYSKEEVDKIIDDVDTFKAFHRTIALKFHPDRNDTPYAENIFKLFEFLNNDYDNNIDASKSLFEALYGVKDADAGQLFINKAEFKAAMDKVRSSYETHNKASDVLNSAEQAVGVKEFDRDRAREILEDISDLNTILDGVINGIKNTIKTREIEKGKTNKSKVIAVIESLLIVAIPGIKNLVAELEGVMGPRDQFNKLNESIDAKRDVVIDLKRQVESIEIDDETSEEAAAEKSNIESAKEEAKETALGITSLTFEEKAEAIKQSLDDSLSVIDIKKEADEEADEDTAVDDVKVKVKSILSKPADGDFDDFIRKYAAIASFISFESDAAGIIEDSSQSLKAGQLINILRKYANIAKKDGKLSDSGSDKVLDASISNLAKFTNKEVDGIIFERAGSSKHFVKINKQRFAGASKLMKQAMEIMFPADAFNSLIIDTFIIPKFELTDSSGSPLYTNIDGALAAFNAANTSKKSVEYSQAKSGRDGVDLGKIIFKIENKPVMELSDGLNLINVRSDLSGEININNMFLTYSDIGGTPEDLFSLISLSSDQLKTVNNFILNVINKDKKAISNVIDKEDITDEAKKQITNIANSTLTPSATQPTSQQPVSRKRNINQDQDIKTAEDLLNHKDIRTLKDRVYTKDESLTYAISSITNTDLLAIKNGNVDIRKDIQNRLIISINPDLTAIKNEIRNLCSDGSEIRDLFDSVMFRKTFNEEAFKGAYGALIVSAIDKIVRSKNSRIAEGFLDVAMKGISLAKATIGNIGTPLLIMKFIGWIAGAAAMKAAAPYLLLFGSGLAARGLWDAYKWSKESEQYRDNPIKYIEGLLDDSKTKKAVRGLINIAVSDIIMKVIDPTYKSLAQGKQAKLRGGQSQFSNEIKALSSSYNKLSDEQKSQAKELNDFILGQIGKTRYYNQGIISDSIVNMIFNKIFFGKNKISDSCRDELLSGTFDIRKSQYRQELIQSLIKAVRTSPVKNNFIDYIERHVRSNNRKGALKMGSEEEIAERDNKTWYGLRKSAYLSNEQIKKEYMEELILDITGMTYEEYSHNENETKNINQEFRESIQNKSLASLLFEDDESRGSAELEDNIKDMEDKGIPKQKAHDREVDIAVASSAVIPWFMSALNMIKMKQVMIGGSKIFKDIHVWKTTPGTSGGTPGLFGYKISASLPKLVNTVFRSPQEAAAIGKAGGDGMGPQFHLPNGKFIQTYYWNGKAVIGNPKSLSMIMGKTGVGAKMIGHASEVAKNVKYLKTQGLNVNLKTGVVTADPKLGCFEIPPSDPTFNLNVKTMANYLEGAVKVQEQETYAWSAFNEEAGFLSDDMPFKPGEEIVAKMSSYLLKNIMGKGLVGDLSDVSELDPALKSYLEKDVLSSILSGKKMDIEMESGNLGDVTPEDLSMTAKAIQSGVQQVANDYKNAAVKLKVAAAKKGTIQSAIDYFKDTSPEGEAFNKTMMKSISDNIFNKTVHGSGVKIVDVVKNLNNDEAHAGLSLTMKKALVGGGLSMTKAPSTATVKTLLAKMTVVKGFTPKDIPVKIPDGLDYKALGIKSAMWTILPVKIMTTFAQRGIQGGKFAEFFYKMFNPQQIFYTDMLRALMGSQVNIPKTQLQITDSDGGFSGQSVNIEEDIMSPTGGNTVMELPLKRAEGFIDVYASQGKSQTGEQTTDESFVYKNNIPDFLFENKLVTRSKKTSRITRKKTSVNKEYSEHKKLQEMFKKLF